MTTNLISELSLTECQQLLDAHHFGRLAFLDQDEGIPMIIPVNYVTHRGKIVFRTDPGAKLTAALRAAPVAFEVDGVHDQEQVGWSVVVQGQVQEVTDTAEVADLRTTPLAPWAPGAKPHYVRIDTDRVGGRRVSVADLPSHWWG